MRQARNKAFEKLRRVPRVVGRHYLDIQKKIWQLINPCDGEPNVVLVAGVQRSGTTMLMIFLERLLETKVYYERDERVFSDYFLRNPSEILDDVRTASSHHHVIRVQFDAHKLRSYMDEFMPCKTVFIFRRYTDVVNSYLRTWPDGRNKVDEIASDRNWNGWQALGMTDATHKTLTGVYRRDLNDASAIALFWWFRNQLFFDLDLHRDPRVLPIRYEVFVKDSRSGGEELTTFIGAKLRKAATDAVYSTSIRKHPVPDIDKAVAGHCDEMYERLTAMWSDKRKELDKDPSGEWKSVAPETGEV